MAPSDPILVPDAELQEQFIRASGPGGQNVNKVATAVELRFDVRRSPSLPPGVRVRLERLAGQRLTRDGILVIRADRFRTQERNRADARERLHDLIQKAAIVPKKRIATRVTRAAKMRRRDEKQQRSKLKRTRRDRPSMD
ncbi:MAG: alternative ribosome rescue aminoacyl-tRNA hydrolase ArfB [Hyphomicrobiaceae bacterium]